MNNIFFLVYSVLLLIVNNCFIIDAMLIATFSFSLRNYNSLLELSFVWSINIMGNQECDGCDRFTWQFAKNN